MARSLARAFSSTSPGCRFSLSLASSLQSTTSPLPPPHRIESDMTSYLPYDVQSLIGVHKGTPSQTPQVGQPAPQLDNVNYSTDPHLIAFVRHCGCPFAEAEVKSLARVQKTHPQIQVIIVAHSEQDVVNDWFDRVGKSSFSSLENVKVVADPKYEVYDKFGIGQLGWGGLFSSSMITELRSLASQGIKNTSTGKGSNRWQNSGG